jgi:hypothetical protein
MKQTRTPVRRDPMVKAVDRSKRAAIKACRAAHISGREGLFAPSLANAEGATADEIEGAMLEVSECLCREAGADIGDIHFADPAGYVRSVAAALSALADAIGFARVAAGKSNGPARRGAARALARPAVRSAALIARPKRGASKAAKRGASKAKG